MNNVDDKSSSISSGASVPDATIALGLGLTNECNLSCAFCYRDPARTDRLSLDQVKSVMGQLPIRSVNLGTGENGMHPDFRAILEYLRKKPIKLTITSNGHSVAVLEDNDASKLRALGFASAGEELTAEQIDKLVAERQQARKQRNFKRADEIRQELADRGILLEDTRDGGIRWKKK